jgi:hypothetical protein
MRLTLTSFLMALLSSWYTPFLMISRIYSHTHHHTPSKGSEVMRPLNYDAERLATSRRPSLTRRYNQVVFGGTACESSMRGPLCVFVCVCVCLCMCLCTAYHEPRGGLALAVLGSLLVRLDLKEYNRSGTDFQRR